MDAAIRQLAREAELEACLAVLGMPAATVPGFLDWLLAECTDYRNGRRISQAIVDLTARTKATGMPATAAAAAEAFLREWITALRPGMLLNDSFYLSRDKITRIHRSYKPYLKKHFIDDPETPDDFAPEDKFLAVYRYFLETANLVFLPAREVLGRALPWGLDPVFYFVGVFLLERPDEVRETFPEFQARATTVGLVNYVFEHPDPFTYQYMNISLYIGPYPVSMTISRKYVAVHSMTIHELDDLLRGRPVLMAGTGSIEVKEGGGYQIHPVACRFTWTRSWREAVKAEGEEDGRTTGHDRHGDPI